jgi:membrane protease subunit HflK
MNILPGWLKRPPILAVETPKGPWGGGGGNGPDGEGTGPRNPWAVPPGGKRPAAKPSALDEFLRKARGAGGGNGGGGGFGGLPQRPNARLLWVIGAAIVAAVWILLTSVHVIGPQQRGVVTYFGRYSGVLTPGFQLTLPAPIAQVEKIDVNKIRTDNFPTGDGENLMITGDQNIVDLAYSVRWDIANPPDFAFELADPSLTVRAAAESAMRAVLATTSLDKAIGAGRNEIEQRVAEETQKILNGYKSGVRIQGVAIKQAAAPQRIVEDFNKVTAAQQEAIANLNQARSYAQQIVARAQGEAEQFNKEYEQYKLAPEVTRRRMYYETMERVLSRTDKTIVETPGVTPYLPLGSARTLPEPVPQVEAAPTPAPAAGGGQ